MSIYLIQAGDTRIKLGTILKKMLLFIFIPRCSNNVKYISSTMGTSQSKRNKISKFRTSSVGTVGELDEQDEDRILNNTGKLSSMKGI